MSFINLILYTYTLTIHPICIVGAHVGQSMISDYLKNKIMRGKKYFYIKAKTYGRTGHLSKTATAYGVHNIYKTYIKRTAFYYNPTPYKFPDHGYI